MGAPSFLAGETLAASQLKLQTLHICTSSTRPGSPWEGLTIWETDTDRIYVYDGSSWRYVAGGTDPTAARAYGSGSTSVGTSATLVALATESYDYGSNFASNTYTCPRAGLLVVSGRVSVASATDGQRFLVAIYKNGSEAIRGGDVPIGAASSVGLTAADTIAVAASDAITLRAQMVTGTAKSTETGETLTYMSCRMLP